ncbi:DUF2267 domain-containing protein [Pyxidicoccus fallax]|uniref:DUF2267 domain-containing protein n=1 Tax=Pyxidicoccus fallax TaxID=394095 RepID=A0A848LRB7_9BACT|nr:DUF2267 domain-containing protein [Pyxidicoccus fallax]NMO20103.1 DUF2267 domain-containing protein [Pyxidicoccus fallax]NPC82577.1 DUF2267 domain-containing protein [Pyxidicoccus fallax]
MTHDEFLSRVTERAGLSDTAEAARTARAVLGVVGERLGRWERRALAEDLPAPLTGMLEDGTSGQDFDLAELHARVACREHVRPGFAMEHTGIVCQVLAEALSEGTLHRLHERLPGPIAALFTPREHRERFEYIHLDPGRGTLAEGRPGSRHPLSEAHPVRAHTHSVARSDNPHEDTKLSSASGFTQEREHETLATGHPRTRSARSDED